jgi:hypothetical protein
LLVLPKDTGIGVNHVRRIKHGGLHLRVSRKQLPVGIRDILHEALKLRVYLMLKAVLIGANLLLTCCWGSYQCLNVALLPVKRNRPHTVHTVRGELLTLSPILSLLRVCIKISHYPLTSWSRSYLPERLLPARPGNAHHASRATADS